MRRLAILTVALLVTALWQAPAQAFGSHATCNDRGVSGHTHTDTLRGFFAGHNVSVVVRACIARDNLRTGKAQHFTWTHVGPVDFPSANPFGVVETMKLTRAPFFYSSTRSGIGHVVQRVVSRFNVKQCTIGIGGVRLCNDWLFQTVMTMLGSRTCVRGSERWICTALHRW